MSIRALVPITLLVLTPACESDLPVASFVDKLRVLAVRAEPPEVSVGNVSVLRALAVEPERVTPTLSYLWLACSEPIGTTTVIPCGLHPGDLHDSLPPACGDSFDGALCTLGTDATATIKPSAALVAGGTATMLVSATIADDGTAADCLLHTAKNNALPTEPDRCVLTVKRVTASNGVTVPNHNPRLSQLDLIDTDGTVRSLLQAGTTVAPSPDANAVKRDLRVQRDDSAEQLADGTYEALSLSWFVDAGKLDGARSSFDPPNCTSQADCAAHPPISTVSTQWEAPTAAKAALQGATDGGTHLWAVLRDDRGGVSWLAGTLSVK